jgi:hypothetical protein
MGVILTGAVFQAKGRISARASGDFPREIPRPAGEDAGLRDDGFKRGVKKHTPLSDSKNNLLFIRPFFIIESFLNHGGKL